MKSSVAVFSNQGDPFPTQTRAKTHYRPSPPQTLTDQQKQTVLSPDRFRSLPHHLCAALSPPDLGFLVGSQRLVPGLPGSDSSEPFDESWPSTDSSNKTPEREEPTTDQERSPACEESVLARYITRFRSGRPTSRRERSPPHSGLKDFWWLQESESPEVPRYRPDSESPGPRPFSPHHLEKTPALEESSLDDSRLRPEDVDVAGLQLRAGKLIQRSKSSLSSVGPVSSEGLGSSPVSTVSSTRMRPPPHDAAPVLPPSLPVTRAPEEDILYQWRLRRKMEQAREGTLPVTSGRRSPSPPVRIPRQAVHTRESTNPVYHVSPQREAQRTSPPPHPISHQKHVPVASPSVTPTNHVPPHLHLLCDILPCVYSHSAPGVPQVTEETVHPGTQEDETVHPGARREETAHPGVRGEEAVHPGVRGEETVHPGARREETVHPGARREETVHPGARGEETVHPGVRGEETVHPGVRGEGTVHSGVQHSDNDALHTGHPVYRHKTPSERRMEERKLKPKGGRRKRDRTEPCQEGPARSGAGPVPVSSVHRAMEQVISERLFSPRPSPKPKPEKQKPRPSTPSTEDESDPQAVEIAAYLLEEAEDSDGTDFADDPLLQVLRDQRESLRSRLRALDSRLARLEE